MTESYAIAFRDKVASLSKSPASSKAPDEPAGYRVPKPFKKT